MAVLEERAVSEKRVVQDKASVSERLVSEKATIFDKTPALRRSQPQARPRPQRGPRPGCAQPQRSARPAPGGQQGAGPEKEPEPLVGPLRAPARHSAGEDPQHRGRGQGPLTDTGLAHLQQGPAALQPRHHLLPDEAPERQLRGGLNPQASVRLPARSVKLGPKLERCHLAMQRSESVKCANPPRTEFLVAPVMSPENATSSRKSWWARAERAQPPAARRTCSSQGWRRRGSTFGSAGPGGSAAGPAEPGDAEGAAGSRPQGRKKPELPPGAEV